MNGDVRGLTPDQVITHLSIMLAETRSALVLAIGERDRYAAEVIRLSQPEESQERETQ